MKYNIIAKIPMLILILSIQYCDSRYSPNNIHYFHKKAVIGNISPKYLKNKPNLLKGKEAAKIAVQILKKKGTKKIKVCRVHWMAAPLGGYLVDAKGELKVNNKIYNVFRIGIRDGSEESNGKFKKGEQFAFISKGYDRNSNTVWIPEGGPSRKETTDFEFYFYKKREFDDLHIDFR